MSSPEETTSGLTGFLATFGRAVQEKRDELNRFRDLHHEKCHQVDTLQGIKNENARNARDLSKRVTALEEENVLLETQLRLTTEKLEEAMSTIEEHDRFKKFLQEQEKLNEVTIEKLENQLRSTKSLKTETERNYEELIHTFALTEKKLEKSEEMIATAEIKLKTSSAELNAMKENLKMLELKNQMKVERLEEHEKSRRELHESLIEGEHTMKTLSSQLQCAQTDLVKMEEDLAQSQIQYHSLLEEMDSCVRDLTAM